MVEKPWYQSKTLWVQLLTLAAGVLGVLVGSDLIAAHPQIASGLVMAASIVNMGLRLITDQPVSLPGK